MLQLIFSVSTLWWMILFLYIPACFGLIIIVLLQKGKGQGLAGAFGMGGGMDTIFGPRSSKSLPQKITYAAAAVFMTLALVMSILSGRVGRSAAPDLAADVQDASMEALFDPTAAPDGPVTMADEEGEVEAETPEAPAPLVTLFDEEAELDVEPAPETPTPDAEEPADPPVDEEPDAEADTAAEETADVDAAAEEAADEDASEDAPTE